MRPFGQPGAIRQEGQATRPDIGHEIEQRKGGRNQPKKGSPQAPFLYTFHESAQRFSIGT